MVKISLSSSTIVFAAQLASVWAAPVTSSGGSNAVANPNAKTFLPFLKVAHLTEMADTIERREDSNDLFAREPIFDSSLDTREEHEDIFARDNDFELQERSSEVGSLQRRGIWESFKALFGFKNDKADFYTRKAKELRATAKKLRAEANKKAKEAKKAEAAATKAEKRAKKASKAAAQKKAKTTAKKGTAAEKKVHQDHATTPSKPPVAAKVEKPVVAAKAANVEEPPVAEKPSAAAPVPASHLNTQAEFASSPVHDTTTPSSTYATGESLAATKTSVDAASNGLSPLS